MANKVPLPEGLVDLSTAHCPIIEPTQLGLPYHGLVVNGKLTLPNGEVRGYPQPVALSHKTVTYCIKPYWLPNPPPGRYTNFGSIVTKYERPYLGGTILVKGPKAYTPKRTKREQAEDYKNGYQWLNHAYLSGTLRAIGGNELEIGTYNDFGDGRDGTNLGCPSSTFVGNLTGELLPGGAITFGGNSGGKEVSTVAKMYNQGYWLYNDGNITWVMKWNISPSTTKLVNVNNKWVVDPIRILRIYVVGPFGLFGFSKDIKMSNKLIYEGPYDQNNDRLLNSGSPVWLPYFSATGAKLTINEVWNWFTTYCGDVYIRYWSAQFVNMQHIYIPYMGDDDVTTGQWSSDMGELWSWAEIDISGVGSLKKGFIGEGIKAKIVIKKMGVDWAPPGYGSYEFWGCGVCATVTPEGQRGYWYLDANPESGTGFLKSTFGKSISYKFREHHEFEPCTNGVTAPEEYVYEGTYLSEDGLFIICYGNGSKVNDYTLVHLQTGSSKYQGISYDIANDRWSTMANSCYV
jgi:hypothetical protein